MVKADDIKGLVKMLSTDLEQMLMLTFAPKDKDYFQYMKVIGCKNSSEELIEKLTNIRNKIDELIKSETDF